MKMSQKGKIFLAGLEGVCLSKYLCSAGVWTIGVGATKSEIPDIANWPKDKTITIEESFELLNTSLKKYEDAVNETLKVEITQNQFDALVSICYNIGTGGTRKSTFMKRINNKSVVGSVGKYGFLELEIHEQWGYSWRTDKVIEYLEAPVPLGFTHTHGTIINAILMWNKPKEIIGRRTKEAKLYSSDNYGDGKILVFPVNSKFQPIYSKGYQIDGNKYL